MTEAADPGPDPGASPVPSLGGEIDTTPGTPASSGLYLVFTNAADHPCQASSSAHRLSAGESRPACPVEPAYVRLPPDVASGTLIEESLTARVADLCNGLYELMLQVLSRYYVHHGETPAELETLARTAKHLMNWVMRKLYPVLTTLPIGPSHPGRTAGPTLDVARPAYFVLPHRDPAWKIINERLDVLTETCAALAQEPGLAALGELAGDLRAMAGDVRNHLDERASVPPGRV